MKKTFIITAISSIALIAFIQSNMIGSLIMFLLFGTVPGTTYVVPSGTMFLIMCAAIWLIIFRFTAIEMLLYRSAIKRTKKHTPDRRAALPRRRFEQV